MVLFTFLGGFFLKRKTLDRAKWTLRFLVISVGLPHIANQTGWGTAEMGRQPWIVYKVLRTSQGVSPSIIPGYVIGSIIMFVVIYSLLFVLFIFLLNRKIQQGPEKVALGKDDQIYRDTYQQTYT